MSLQEVPNPFELVIHGVHLIPELIDRLRGPNPRDYILPLGIGEVFAVKGVLPGAWITGEGNARRRIVPHIPKYHGADVNRRSIGHIGCDLKPLPVIDGPFAHPRLEDGFDGQLQLPSWIFWETISGLFSNNLLILTADLGKGPHIQVRIELGSVFPLCLLKDHIEILLVHA